MIRDTNPPEAGRRESGVSEPKTTLFGVAFFQKIRGFFNHVFSEHDTGSNAMLNAGRRPSAEGRRFFQWRQGRIKPRHSQHGL
jgi:hypothetical protein